MGMKGNADDYEKGIDHSVSINSADAEKSGKQKAGTQTSYTMPAIQNHT